MHGEKKANLIKYSSTTNNADKTTSIHPNTNHHTSLSAVILHHVHGGGLERAFVLGAREWAATHSAPIPEKLYTE